MYFIGIDQSKRSTGIVAVNDKGELVDALLISPPQQLDGVELIIYQWDMLNDFLGNLGAVPAAVIEGLSFGSIGSSKDLLAGLNWYFRVRMAVEHGIFLGVVPVTMWRSTVLDKAEQKAAKQEKDGLKKAVVQKLPEDVRLTLETYSRGFKKLSIYDLADAYFLAQYRRGLS